MYADERETWLANHDRTEGDVMIDEETAIEYIYIDGEKKYEKVELPEYLQSSYESREPEEELESME